MNNLLKNRHLVWRAGFGPTLQEYENLQNNSSNQIFDSLVKKSSGKITKLAVAEATYTDEFLEMSMTGKVDSQTLAKQLKIGRQAIKRLNIIWLNEMVTTKAQLREKMAFFWHGHFACRTNNAFHCEKLLHVIRENALGDFRKLLKEVSLSGAMLYFLNNQQNKKDHPNENFAREVMELFTLGRGNYTEQDIKEAAKAFTGWSSDKLGEFVFRQKQHDNSQKKFLGKTGNFDGEDILNILLEQKQTAYFIVSKLYKFFVNEKVNIEEVKKLGDRFYQHYNIAKLLEDIFTSKWFYDEKNIGSKIKSPVELLVGIQRTLPISWQDTEPLLIFQKLLGQMLFKPPNVAGWPGGQSWIDSSSLMMRMRLPQMLNAADELNVRPKTDDDEAMGQMQVIKTPTDIKKLKKTISPIGKKIKASVDWIAIEKSMEDVPREKIIGQLNLMLLAGNLQVSENLIQDFSDASSKTSFIRSAAIHLMSTPEYQLC